MWSSSDDREPERNASSQSSERLTDKALIFFANKIFTDFTVMDAKPPAYTLAALGFETSDDIKSMTEDALYNNLVGLRNDYKPENVIKYILEALLKDDRGALYEDFQNHLLLTNAAQPTPRNMNNQDLRIGSKAHLPGSAQIRKPASIDDIAKQIRDFWYPLGDKMGVDLDTLHQIRIRNLMNTETAAKELFDQLTAQGLIKKDIPPDELWSVLSPYLESGQ